MTRTPDNWNVVGKNNKAYSSSVKGSSTKKSLFSRLAESGDPSKVIPSKATAPVTASASSSSSKMPASSSSSSSKAPAPASGGPAFSAKAVRNLNDIALTKAQFTKAYRTSAPADERIKLYKGACTGSEKKLKKIDYAKMSQDSSTFSDNKFDNIVEMNQFLLNMKDHFIKYDMAYFFMNFPVLEDSTSGVAGDEGDRFRSGITVNLFDLWTQIGVKKDIVIENIADSMKWLQMYTEKSSEAFLEDLEWTHRYLIDSMAPALAESVQNVLQQNYQGYAHGGPLTYAIMLDLAVNLSSSSILNIQNSIRSYQITNVPGEDVELVSKRLLHVYQSLEDNNSLSSDLVSHLFKLLSTTSVDDFNSMIGQWKNCVIMGMEEMPSYQAILKRATMFYNRLMSMNEWTATNNQGSAFKAGGTSGGSGGKDWVPVCHHCKQPGHIRPNCPLLKKNKDKNEWTLAPTQDMKVSDDPLRYEKKISGETVFWCSKCGQGGKKGKWTKSHHTDTHHGGNPSAMLAKETDSPSSEDKADPTPSEGMDFKKSLLGAAARN